MYADTVTPSMEAAIRETARRRAAQEEYRFEDQIGDPVRTQDQTHRVCALRRTDHGPAAGRMDAGSATPSMTKKHLTSLSRNVIMQNIIKNLPYGERTMTFNRSEMMMRPMCMAMAMCMMRRAHFSAAGGMLP